MEGDWIYEVTPKKRTAHQTTTPIWALHKGELDLLLLVLLTASMPSETQLLNK